MKEIVIASDNINKIKEYQHKLKSYKLIPYKELINIDPIPETGKTFRENAYLKAATLAKLLNKPCIGDDSGLVVEALPNLLGIHSKRFSKAETASSNNELLLEKLKNKKSRNAKFITVICLYIPGLEPFYYQGELIGEIVDKPRGKNGFGYDPLFYIKDKNKTLAELTLTEKNKISHRGKAIDKLKKDLDNENIDFF
ncbi:MAG: RdgB/HAM1 family non-canonical purine NTP pyrophosphatase [Candidatus Izimaplasma sp.]|nr:RdgB/HAM1 family non-canonical purine NTP pyrophosphatase [Candidatus Izimaplasma bacterium]